MRQEDDWKLNPPFILPQRGEERVGGLNVLKTSVK